MEPVNDSVLALLDKLFRLGEHPTTNPHEAANALALAQAMLLKHNLTRGQIITGGQPATPEKIGKVEIKSDTGHDWKVRLAAVIARANLCYVVNSKADKTTHLFGNKTNVMAVVKMYDWVSRELEWQALKGYKEYKADYGTEASRTWKGAFFDGAILAIRDRLLPEVNDFAVGTGREIVLANTALVKEAVNRVFPLRSKGRHTYRSDRDGFGAGRKAGQNIRFGPQGSLPGGSKALSAGP